MSDTKPDGSPKIYLLPNLMTAGNLFCGFAASLSIVESALIMARTEGLGADKVGLVAQADGKIYLAIWLILASCIFDLLDGRLARLGGAESPFGREFDSLADVVSFGVAPALMVHRIVLHQFTKTGWIIASIYLICGALRLARFNCIAASNNAAATKDFTGFPIPAAAGFIASLTLFLLWMDDRIENAPYVKWLLAVLMLFLAWMMFSKFKYPSFKGIGWKTKRSMPKFLIILFVLVFTILNYQWMPFVIFLVYLLYGFTRPFLSRQMKHEIEDEDDEDEPGAEPLP
jgi:CDP-diacylglycerol--serine O-phosphatidyltransferase